MTRRRVPGSPPSEEPRVEIAYRRPPDRIRRYRQELLHDGDSLKLTLLRQNPGADPIRIADAVTLDEGSSLLWFTFPGKWYEVAAFYDPEGELLGHYTNVIRPASFEGDRWSITDLFLDVWQPADAPEEPEILDREELHEARRRGWIEEGEADRAEATTDRIRRRAASGEWPPAAVRKWGLEAAPSLRIRRDEPGIYYANLITGRIIAWGIYLMGAVSVTSLVLAASTDTFEARGSARALWLALMAFEAVVLLALSLAGKLPATRRVRPRRVLTEETLFLGSTAMCLAVLLVGDSALWRTLLISVFSALALFLVIFAACRAAIDRDFPGTALGGLAVCLLAFLLL